MVCEIIRVGVYLWTLRVPNIIYFRETMHKANTVEQHRIN